MDVLKSFGCNVFDENVMRQRLDEETYKSLRDVIEGNSYLTSALADTVAIALKEWAVEHGATHYTHWFQPMTGLTAEKHDAFFSPNHSGSVLLDFSGRQLVKGEADASSFPSGGLRASFEARGYTTWDCTSPPFLRVDAGGATTLCIPTAFCSFSGEALDEKTPLLRSMAAISAQALRVLTHLGVKARRVQPTVGAEQEYFLVDKQIYKKRKDLIYTGRTLFGAQPAKGQELEDQYYAAMNERVSAFMKELNEELWKLGVPAKTQHYEAAPAQYELAPMFSTANIATDHNQIVMEMMRKVADRHDFACLLHEKPFEGVNGSGKHNNWALETDTGINLLKPGKKSDDNLVFLTFFSAVIAAVDNYAEALRMSCATLSNQARLGGNEAPPAIISIFVGQKFCDMLEDFSNGLAHVLSRKEHMTMGVSSLPVLHKDNADRNRTSPFAFTGNKFEFRMLGSSQSLGFANTVLNTIVAEELRKIADELDKTKDNQDFSDVKDAVRDIVSKLVEEHGRILFNGNSYDEKWREEAKKRGLPILDNTVEAIQQFANPKIIAVFKRHNVLTEAELEARREVNLKSYAKHASIEARTMIKMSRQSIIPVCLKYCGEIAGALNQIKAANTNADSSVHEALLESCTAHIKSYSKAVERVEEKLATAQTISDVGAQAQYFYEEVIPAMDETRKDADHLEKIVDKAMWPLPSYGEMLFHVL